MAVPLKYSRTSLACKGYRRRKSRRDNPRPDRPRLSKAGVDSVQNTIDKLQKSIDMLKHENSLIEAATSSVLVENMQLVDRIEAVLTSPIRLPVGALVTPVPVLVNDRTCLRPIVTATPSSAQLSTPSAFIRTGAPVCRPEPSTANAPSTANTSKPGTAPSSDPVGCAGKPALDCAAASGTFSGYLSVDRASAENGVY